MGNAVKEIKRIKGIHPISVNYIENKGKYVGLRLYGIPMERNCYDALYAWDEFKKCNGVNGLSLPAEVLKAFAHTVPLRVIELHVRDMTDVETELAVSANVLQRSEDAELNAIRLSDGVTVVNKDEMKDFRPYLRLLYRETPCRTSEKLTNTPLFVSKDTNGLRFLYLNSNAPLCYLPGNVVDYLKTCDSVVENGILKIGSTQPVFILCEGKGRHVGKNLGTQLMVDLNNGIVTLYRGIYSQKAHTFAVRDTIFDPNVFSWCTRSREDFSNVYGLKNGNTIKK